VNYTVSRWRLNLLTGRYTEAEIWHRRWLCRTLRNKRILFVCLWKYERSL